MWYTTGTTVRECAGGWVLPLGLLVTTLIISINEENRHLLGTRQIGLKTKWVKEKLRHFSWTVASLCPQRAQFQSGKDCLFAIDWTICSICAKKNQRWVSLFLWGDKLGHFQRLSVFDYDYNDTKGSIVPSGRWLMLPTDQLTSLTLTSCPREWSKAQS